MKSLDQKCSCCSELLELSISPDFICTNCSTEYEQSFVVGEIWVATEDPAKPGWYRWSKQVE